MTCEHNMNYNIAKVLYFHLDLDGNYVQVNYLIVIFLMIYLQDLYLYINKYKHLHVTSSVINLFHLKSYPLIIFSSISSSSNAMLCNGCWECNPFYGKSIERCYDNTMTMTR